MAWQDQLRSDPIPWLLEQDNPSVRYYTLRDLLDRPANDVELTAAKAAIMARPPATTILDLQRPDGSWREDENSYNPMYKSTVWQVIFLGMLGANGDDERVRRGVEWVFDTMQAEDGSFPNTGRRYRGNLLCMESQVVRALLRLGYGADPRTRRALDFLWTFTTAQAFACRFTKDQLCGWGAVKALHALAEVPPAERSPGVHQAIEQATELLIEGDLAGGGDPDVREISDHWRRFSFPRGYNSDILEALVALARLGFTGDERLKPAIEFMLSKQGADGRWKSAHVLTGKLLVDLDRRGGPSKWITLNACRVLKAKEQS